MFKIEKCYKEIGSETYLWVYNFIANHAFVFAYYIKETEIVNELAYSIRDVKVHNSNFKLFEEIPEGVFTIKAKEIFNKVHEIHKRILS